MTAVGLPALDGRTPLGFLAALGVLRLLTESQPEPVTLSWSTTDCSAVLSGPWSATEAIADNLRSIVASIPDDGVLPGLPADLPPRGEAPDRMRLPRPEFRDLAVRVAGAGEPGERWMSSLVTDLSVDDKGRADISLFTAPSGKQSMRTMLQKPLEAVRRRPEVLLEALISWRRYPGITGEYLDHRVLFDAADAPDGTSRERGVPGATWLALMSYPLLLTTAGPGGAPTSTGWQYPTGREAGRQLVYPLWSAPLDVPGVKALLSHPVLSGARPGAASRAAQVLTIFLVCAAGRRRIPGRTFAGVLVPIRPNSVAHPRSRARRKA
jgi:hypothetical protein